MSFITLPVAAAQVALSLTDGKILIGNASNVAEEQAVTGDIAITNGGVTSISSGVIVNADVNASAAIAYSKLAALTSAHILVGSAGNVATDVAVTGDVTISNAGVTAIATGIIVNADINASAAVDFSKLATLTSGNVLVGSAGNVATSVAMAGDVTIVAAGTTTIGAGKVLESMVKVTTGDGLNVKRIAKVVFNSGSGFAVGAHALGATLPNNSFVTGAWYWVKTTFTSAGDLATIALSIEGANDVVTATAINAGGDIWDTTAKPVEGIPKIETTSTWLKTTASRALTATVAVEDVTAGVLYFWVEYITVE